jgi:hypothetical protein
LCRNYLFQIDVNASTKSLLFIIPVLNVVAAEACKKLWSGRDKSWFRKLLAVGAVFHVLANVAFSVFMLIVSSQNYPGENSLRFIHGVGELSNLYL